MTNKNDVSKYLEWVFLDTDYIDAEKLTISEINLLILEALVSDNLGTPGKDSEFYYDHNKGFVETDFILKTRLDIYTIQEALQGLESRGYVYDKWKDFQQTIPGQHLFQITNFGKEFLEELRVKIQKGKRKKGVSGSFLLNDILLAKLKDVRYELVSASLIEKTITTDELKSIFKGKPIKNKINWIGSLPSLRYFIGNLPKPHSKYLIKTCECFLHNGNLIDLEILRNNRAEKTKFSDKEVLDKVKEILSVKFI